MSGDAICFRCDWQGSSDAGECPQCGAPLYRGEIRTEEDRRGNVGVEPAPAATEAAVRASASATPPASTATHVASSDGGALGPRDNDDVGRGEPRSARTSHGPTDVVVHGDDGTPPRPGRSSGTRPVRIVAVLVVVALVVAYLSSRHGDSRRAAAETRPVGGTLVYVSAGGDGTTGRLWRVHLATGSAVPGPRTVLPDQIVASGPGERWVGVRAGGTAYVYRDLSTEGTPQFLAAGQLAAWAPGGNAVFVVTREASARGQCPALKISFVDSISHGSADLYDAPSCSTADGLAVDGLTRPFVSLAGPTDAGVYELGYKQLHLVVPKYLLLSVSSVGDLLVGPRIQAPPGRIAAPVARTLLVWQGVGGPTIIGDADHDLSAERFLAWSKDGHRTAVLGTMNGVRSVWMIETGTHTGRQAPARVAPALSEEVESVGAAFAGPTLITAAAGRLYASGGRGYRDLELPHGAPPPSGPLLWLDR